MKGGEIMKYEQVKNCPMFKNGVRCAPECAWYRETKKDEPFYLRCALVYGIQRKEPKHETTEDTAKAHKRLADAG